MEQLQLQGIHIDYCVVGEPSSTKKVGDVIKIGDAAPSVLKLASMANKAMWLTLIWLKTQFIK